VLLLGAGPVGLELAGEIRAQWPDKAVTIIDPGHDILSGALSGGLPDELRSELRRQLDELDVELLIGTSLTENPPGEPGQAKTFTVTTDTGIAISADIWFRCHGVAATGGYLSGDLAPALRPGGQIAVTDQMRVVGHDRDFALGDVTAIPEPKMAAAALRHSAVVAANIATLIAGGTDLAPYEPAPPGIVIPLGPGAGAAYRGDMGLIGADQTAQMKGADLNLAMIRGLLGVG
jgi:NADH dehydrogenase FAD-containing subunit